MATLYAGLLGACIGSFLNVVIYRMPRQVSVVRPGSCCPQCRKALAWRHTIPLLSFLWLRGHCACCRARIPRSYPLVEAGTALLFGALVQVFGWSLLSLRYVALASMLIAAAEIDRRHGLIPNRLVAAGAGLGLALALATEAAALATYVAAALVSGGLLLIVRAGSRLVSSRPGLGMGDVKLAAMMGLYLGWANLWVFYLAAVLGGTLGLVGLVTGRLERTAGLPFAPFVAVATGLHLFLLPSCFPPS